MLQAIQKAVELAALYDCQHTDWDVHEVAAKLRLVAETAIDDAGTRRHPRDGHARGSRLQAHSIDILKAGDIVEVGMEEIGTIRNPVLRKG